jgi:hypothetical protein
MKSPSPSSASRTIILPSEEEQFGEDAGGTNHRERPQSIAERMGEEQIADLGRRAMTQQTVVEDYLQILYPMFELQWLVCVKLTDNHSLLRYVVGVICILSQCCIDILTNDSHCISL